MLYETMKENMKDTTGYAEMQGSIFGGSLSFFFNSKVFDFFKAD